MDYTGWETRRRWRNWSRTSVRRELRQAYRDGVRITADGLIAAGKGELYSAVRMLFGGMRRARSESRIDFPLIERMPEAELLAILRDCVRADGTLRRADVSSTSIYNALLARYGGMDGARRALGVAGPGDVSKKSSATRRTTRRKPASKKKPAATTRRTRRKPARVTSSTPAKRRGAARRATPAKRRTSAKRVISTKRRR